MRAYLLLADYAQTDGTGKVNAIGLGWSVTTTPTPAQSVIVMLKVGWTETNRQHGLEISLLTTDGNDVVLAPSPLGDQPMRIEATFEVGRPAGIPSGSDVDHNLAVNIGAGLPLTPGRYEWRLKINDESREEWTAPFIVRTPRP